MENDNFYPRLIVLLQKQISTSERHPARDLVQSSPLPREFRVICLCLKRRHYSRFFNYGTLANFTEQGRHIRKLYSTSYLFSPFHERTKIRFKKLYLLEEKAFHEWNT
jgi:hypothetical protein